MVWGEQRQMALRRASVLLRGSTQMVGEAEARFEMPPVVCYPFFIVWLPCEWSQITDNEDGSAAIPCRIPHGQRDVCHIMHDAPAAPQYLWCPKVAVGRVVAWLQDRSQSPGSLARPSGAGRGGAGQGGAKPGSWPSCHNAHASISVMDWEHYTREWGISH